MKVDLHIHSTYSDSSRTPEEIVHLAKERNVALLSICDHATIGAYDVLPALCRENNIAYILGVELSVMWQDEEIHMLAYNFDPTSEPLRRLIAEQAQAIDCEYIVYNMCKDYPQMSLEDYRKFQPPAEQGGWKYLHYAVAKGATKTYEEANQIIYRKYSAPNHLSDLGKWDLLCFCQMVKQAGGIPVLAHPGYLYLRDPDGFMGMLTEMKECGIEGIECYYPSHTRVVTDICVVFCREHNLRITGGCDCHGSFDQSEGFTIGALDIDITALDLSGMICDKGYKE